MSETKEVIQEHQKPLKQVRVDGKVYKLDHGKATGVPANVADKLVKLDGVREAAKKGKPPDEPNESEPAIIKEKTEARASARRGRV